MAAKFRITFHRCVQDSQEYGSNAEHMVSRVFFTLAVNGKNVGDYEADLKQTVGDDFESGSIEVSKPHGYDGAWNHAKFSDAASKYFRSLVGSQGTGIRITNSTNIRMQNNKFGKEWTVEFD